MEEQNTQNRFYHDRLHNARHDIRLVKFLTNSADLLEFELAHTDYFNQGERYIAISYTWQPESPKHEILLNGKLFTVGHNLWHCLRYLSILHDFNLDTWIWVDQICIDQCLDARGLGEEAALTEKATQVSCMHSIFSSADMVAAWLGPPEDDSDYAIAYIKSPLRRTSMDEDLGLKALSKLFERRYWSRLWIIPEQFCARRVKFFCGTEAFWREDVTSAQKWYGQGIFRLLGFDEAEGRQRDQHIAKIMAAAVYDHNLDLVSAVYDFRGLDCEKQLDRVYALLPLGQKSNSIPVDYNKSPEEVLVDVARSYWEGNWTKTGGSFRHMEYPDLRFQTWRLATSMIKDRPINRELVAALAVGRISAELLRNAATDSNPALAIMCRAIMSGQKQEWHSLRVDDEGEIFVRS
jgi:hypothetical protein